MKFRSIFALAPAAVLFAAPAFASSDDQAKTQKDKDTTYKSDTSVKSDKNGVDVTTDKSDSHINSNQNGISASKTDKNGKTDKDSVAINKSDKKFIEDAAKLGNGEVELSQLAATHSQNGDVTSFAKTMIDDHTKANNELMELARNKGIEMPADDAHAKNKDLEKMNGLQGEKFDNKYVKKMVSDHKDAVKLFEKESKDGNDTDLRNFASQTLPTLQHHLGMAQQLEKDLKNKKSASAE
jgi:putative membrane protein